MAHVMLCSMATTTFPAPPTDERVTSGILTPPALAALEGMSESTAYGWTRDGLVTARPTRRGWPSIPLLGLAEGHLAWRLRRHHLPMEEVRGVLDLIRDRGSSAFAALSKNLVTDGVYAYLRQHEGLGRIVDQQLAMESVMEQYVTQLLTDEDGFVYRYQVAQLPNVVIDPDFNAGRMMFADSSVPVFAVAGLLSAGEPEDVVAEEYGVSLDDVRSIAAADPAWLSLVA